MATSEQRISRRKLLTRAGAGAAVLGAGAMVTAGSAAALELCPACDCTWCGDLHECAHDAYCFSTTEGCCFCAQNAYCKDLSACDTSADCPPGWACALTCCMYSRYGPLCVPPHGTYTLDVTRTGPTTATRAHGSGGAHGGSGGGHAGHGV